MTNHEQPAARVADYRNFPGHSMCCRCVSCENANRNRDLWFPGDPPRAPTDAGGAVSEARVRLLEDGALGTICRLDYVIALDGPNGPEHPMVSPILTCERSDFEFVEAALTPAPQAEGAGLPGHADQCCCAGCLAQHDKTQPLQQWGEVTREQVARVLCRQARLLQGFKASDGYTLEDEVENSFDLFVTDADAILALFASLAADRDKAVGLLRRWDETPTRSGPKGATRAFLSSQTEGR